MNHAAVQGDGAKKRKLDQRSWDGGQGRTDVQPQVLQARKENQQIPESLRGQI